MSTGNTWMFNQKNNDWHYKCYFKILQIESTQTLIQFLNIESFVVSVNP